MTKKFRFIIPVLLMMFISVPAFSLDFGQAAYETRGGLNAGLVLNPEGKGDLLIFPYFDVRPMGGKPQDTLFVIINEGTNPGDQGVAAKLRFREWDKSQEIFDCEIWLSKNDVWVGIVELNPVTGVAKITSPDYVITSSTSSSFTIERVLKNGFDFFTTNITGFTLPAGWTAAQMTHVGYFEVIGEERTASKAASTADKTTVARLVEQDVDCPNTLMGQAYIVIKEDGVLLGYNATAIANFSRNQGSLYDFPGSLIPTLLDAEDSIDQLDFQLAKRGIFAAYSIEEDIAAKSSLIVTFPTKFFKYVGGKGARIAGSNNPFQALQANDGEQIILQVFDRNENLITPEESWWSPLPKVSPLSLPFEVNICGMYPGENVKTDGYSDRNNVAFPARDFKNGWIWVDLSAKSAEPILIDGNPLTYDLYGYFGNPYTKYYGLPAIALQLIEAKDLTTGKFYGDLTEAWYEVDWIPLSPQ